MSTAHLTKDQLPGIRELVVGYWPKGIEGENSQTHAFVYYEGEKWRSFFGVYEVPAPVCWWDLTLPEELLEEEKDNG